MGVKGHSRGGLDTPRHLALGRSCLIPKADERCSQDGVITTFTPASISSTGSAARTTCSPMRTRSTRSSRPNWDPLPVWWQRSSGRIWRCRRAGEGAPGANQGEPGGGLRHMRRRLRFRCVAAAKGGVRNALRCSTDTSPGRSAWVPLLTDQGGFQSPILQARGADYLRYLVRFDFVDAKPALFHDRFPIISQEVFDVRRRRQQEIQSKQEPLRCSVLNLIIDEK